MATKKAKAKARSPRFPYTCVPASDCNCVLTDHAGDLWRLDTHSGTLRRVVIEKPAKPPKKR